MSWSGSRFSCSVSAEQHTGRRAEDGGSLNGKIPADDDNCLKHPQFPRISLPLGKWKTSAVSEPALGFGLTQSELQRIHISVLKWNASKHIKCRCPAAGLRAQVCSGTTACLRPHLKSAKTWMNYWCACGECWGGRIAWVPRHCGILFGVFSACVVCTCSSLWVFTVWTSGLILKFSCHSAESGMSNAVVAALHLILCCLWQAAVISAVKRVWPSDSLRSHLILAGFIKNTEMRAFLQIRMS